METQATFSTLRAVSALVLKRLIQPIVFMIVILLTAGYVSTALLALSFSGWWWLLLLILAPLTLFFGLIVYVLRFFLQRLLPRKLSQNERQKINEFTDKLFRVAEHTSTPYPVLLFLIGKDVIRGRESVFLRNLIGDSKTITKDFEDVQTLFKR